MIRIRRDQLRQKIIHWIHEDISLADISPDQISKLVEKVFEREDMAYGAYGRLTKPENRKEWPRTLENAGPALRGLTTSLPQCWISY